MTLNTLQLLAPFDGVIVPLANVADATFSSLMMGDGLAIEPLSSTLLAPCDGEVIQLARTGHALTLRTVNSLDVLIHIGIDTVSLNGKGFTTRIKRGDYVRCGDRLIDVDMDMVARLAPSLQTMIIVTSEGHTIHSRAVGIVKGGHDLLLAISATSVSAAVELLEGQPSYVATATVNHGGGLHARPAAKVQASARPFDARIELEFNGQSANARSMVALMSLGVNQGDQVTVHAAGQDADAAMVAVVAALEAHSEGGHLGAERSITAPVGTGLVGICAAPGLALGNVVRIDHIEIGVPSQGEGVGIELDRLVEALTKVRIEISQAVASAERRQSIDEAGIFTAHLAFADDPELIKDAEQGILQGQSAGFAFRRAVETQCAALQNTGNPLLSERASDLKDLEYRALVAMGYVVNATLNLQERSILVGEDMTPSQLTSFPREKLAGFATARGGATSHVAILARALGIPALVAVGSNLLTLKSAQEIVLDANNGIIDEHPSDEKRQRVGEQINQSVLRRIAMLESATNAACTTDGIRIEVAANISNDLDARTGVDNGADGVGLLRTEFLFSERQHMPDQDEQRKAYQSVMDALGERAAIIRTLDVGGDKEVPYLPALPEMNPALGLRGIRTGFAHPHVLDVQLRALLSVRPLSRVRILIPMITEVAEIHQVRGLLDRLCAEMGINQSPQLGAMIEVPAAAVLADQIARHVDFLSIGTNDLTQYALAMDRCHDGLAGRLDPMHPSVLRLIAMTVAGARQHGKWVGMCGSMASDPEATPILLGLGVTELSVSPTLIPEIKAQVRQLSVAECARHVNELLTLESAVAVRQAARRCWPR